LRKEEGNHLPQDLFISTVAKFEMLKDKWPHEAWSIVLNISSLANAEGIMVAGIRLLVPENAPQGLLSAGSGFELYEGRKCVAKGKVL